MKNKDKAVERLCQAIIVQAAQDYLEETKVLKELLSCEPPPDPPKPPVKNGEKKGVKEERSSQKMGGQMLRTSI